jgi:hypothetical protein
MKPTAPVEGDQIPLDDPEPDMMDTPPEGGPPLGPEGGAEDPMGAEPPAMDAPLGPEGGAGEEPLAAAGTGAITGKYNSSPVGDVKMTKSKGTYNTYKLELSMGQLEVILNALEKNHDDPVADELLATFQYYIDKLPGPGEEEEEAEARNNPQAAAAKAAGGEEALPGEETPIPMPPGQEAGGGKDLANMPEPPSGEAMPPGKARLLGAGKAGLPGPDTEGARKVDHELPPPPSE